MCKYISAFFILDIFDPKARIFLTTVMFLRTDKCRKQYIDSARLLAHPEE